MKKIAVIGGSTRPRRLSEQLARWVTDELNTHPGARYTYIDLREVNLPFFDEPYPPRMQNYQHEHTRKWAQTIDSFDGFVFVVPQYNHGYPAVVKNAIDFLSLEWKGKPAQILAYGFHGGNLAAEQLEQVLTGLEMRPLLPHILYTLGRDNLSGFTFVNVPEIFEPLIEPLSRTHENLLAQASSHSSQGRG